jgi:hypothetical protein
MCAVFREGKFNVFQGAFTGDGRSIPGLIESGSEIVGCIEQDAGPDDVGLIIKSEFMDVLAGLRVD